MAQAQSTEDAATSPIRADVIDTLAVISDGSPLQSLRQQRPDVVRHTQGSYDALLEPTDANGVSHEERHLIALRVAVLTTTPVLAEHHRARLHELGVTDEQIAAVEHFPEDSTLSQREIALYQHVDRLTNEPRAATKAHIEHLQAVGFGAPDIVTIAQLIAFVNYQVRLLAGLRIWGTAA